MHPLPQPLPSLIFVSIGVSVLSVALALAGLSLGASPLLWTIPAAFAATLLYHITMLTLARVEPHGSSRLFSRFKVLCGFVIAASWTCSLCVAITATALRAKGVFPKYEMHVGIWLMITCAALSLLESGLTWAIAILTRKERRRITYAAKWRPIAADHSWSINR